MVFKLVIAASKTWRRLKGENRLPMIVDGVTFADGVANMRIPIDVAHDSGMMSPTVPI